MKTRTSTKNSSLDGELYKIFNDLFSDNDSEEAVREAKKAFSFIRKDALYKNNSLLNAGDE